MDSAFIETMLLSFKIAFLTTAILLPIGIALALFLCRRQSALSLILEVLIWMPLILPPSVLGFYMLITFSPASPIGALIKEVFDTQFVFTFHGLVLASVLFNLPFMTNPIKSALSALPRSLKESAYMLGKGRLYTTAFVLLPNAISGVLVGCVTTFTHTLGEFGVVMMIGGSIAGETRTASIAIYNEVETLNYTLAHSYAASLFVVSFAMLLVIFYLNRRLSPKSA